MPDNTDKSAIKIVFADWLLTMNAPPQFKMSDEASSDSNSEKALTKHGIVFQGNVIVDIAPQTALKEKYPNIEVQDLGESLLMPGFINSHCHAAMNLLRGVNDNLSLNDWLNKVIFPLEKQFVNNEFVYQGTQHAIAEMLRSGTTCFQDMYFMPDQAAQAVHEAGIRANIGLIVTENKTQWANDAQEYINKGLSVRDQFKHQELIDFSFAPHALYSVTEQTMKKLIMLSNELAINLQIHLHECLPEISQSLKKYKHRPLELAQKLGMLSPQFNAFHMTQLIDEEIKQLALSGSHVIHCPQSNLKLASGICPISQLTQAGVNVAIGTDGAASNNDLDMLDEIQSAVWLSSKAIHDKFEDTNSILEKRPPSFTAYQGLYAGTMGGAKALGISDKVGSLEVGKEADFISIDLSGIETQPVYDPISQVVYSSSRNQIKNVWVAGKQLLDDRKLTTINETLVIKNSKEWQKKISNYLEKT